MVAELSTILNTRPSAIVLSGNGLQPYWPIEDVVTGLDAMALLRRWGRLVRHVASKHGGKVDSVYDLTRILRIPGSLNHKDSPAKSVVCLTDTGYALGASDIDAALTEYNVPELPEDRQQLGDVVAPIAEWAFRDRTCSYVNQMVAAWATDDVDGTVDELASKGVVFEQYDMDPIKTNEKGVAEFGGDKIAWFKDPDGNILAVGSGYAPPAFDVGGERGCRAARVRSLL